MRAKPPGIVPDQLFGGQPTGPLDKPTLDLANIDGRVQRPPDIMQDVGPQDPVLAGQQIHRYLGHGGAIGIIEEWPAAATLLVPVDFRGRVEACRRQRDAAEIAGFDRLGKAHHRAAGTHFPVGKGHRVGGALMLFGEMDTHALLDGARRGLGRHAVQVGAG